MQSCSLNVTCKPEVSNWILTITNRTGSSQDKLCHKQMHISKFFSRVHLFSSHQQNQSLHKHKTKHTCYTHSWRVSPFNSSPVKRTHKARTCWYRRLFCLNYQYQISQMEQKMKPIWVVDHIGNTAGVDKSDQMITYLPLHRKKVKRSKKLFLHLLALVMI